MIYVSQPLLDNEEKKYVNEALEQGAISGLFGPHLPKFENDFACFCECKYGVAVTSGTTALHLALAVLDIGPGDEVLVPTYTNMATFFAVLYLNATPIPIDVEPDTWNLSASKIEDKITDKTKAIIPVHIFGHPVDMDPVLAIANKYKLSVIEDCAQAHGAEYKGKKVGSFGHIGCFSFYGNKIITTGEGGMLVSNQKHLMDRARSMKSLAFGTEHKFLHKELGYNYRMTNLQAAIGCAQLLKIEKIIQAKRTIATWYKNKLKDCPLLSLPIEKANSKSVYWMYHVVLTKDASIERNKIMSLLAEEGIETREGFIPYNQQTALEITKGLEASCPNANYIGANSFYLPTGPSLTKNEVNFICEKLLTILSTE
jgi:perosamine synthetase